MAHPSYPNLTVLEHPLIQHKLSILRDKSTPVKDFKQLVSEIAMLMTYEVTRDLDTEEVLIETPLEKMKARRVAGKKLSLVPILRAGLGMVEGITQLVPSAHGSSPSQPVLRPSTGGSRVIAAKCSARSQTSHPQHHRPIESSSTTTRSAS